MSDERRNSRVAGLNKELRTKNQEQPPPAAYFNLPISPLNFMSIYPTQEYAVGYLVIKMKKTFTLIDEN
jgi:hypothetical protein